jgi:hypothetical protein
MKRRYPTPKQAIASPLLSFVSLILAGCWTIPNANVQPGGEARLIQGGIGANSLLDPVIVRAIDLTAHTLVLSSAESAATTYRVSPRVTDLGRVRVGEKLRPEVREEFTVYVLRAGQAPGPSGAPQAIAATARVLGIEPSYRLLTLQYLDGQHATFKVGLEVKLSQMEVGDSVAIRAIEVTRLRKDRF